MSRAARSLATVLGTAALLGTGCGYTAGFEAHTSGIQTVALKVVDNATFRQRFERDLTRAIAVKLNEYSGYRHSQSRRADAILEVSIVQIRNTTLVLGQPIQEGAIDIDAQIRLIERRSGRVIVDTHLRDIAEYRTLIGEDSTTARAELVSDLGRRIVLALEADF